MGSLRKMPVVLLADDDADDRLLTQDAFAHGSLVCELRTVCDGVELFDYLLRRGKYAAPAVTPEPALILLDLNMPRMDGREALVRLRADETLRHIPVIVLTTSKSDDDIVGSYVAGSNSFITKPVSFAGLVEAMRAVGHYWFDVVELPSGPQHDPIFRTYHS
ncbi:MAG: response regulator [Azoarcus sp.]|nr:response regulator [Azoarcus sp.]